jgi:hypothetical protein
MRGNQLMKEKVIRQIADGRSWEKAAKHHGREKWLVGEDIVHVRYRSGPVKSGATYAYNINPNTLTADYEVWICGSPECYYLIPMRVIRTIYNHPEAYVDWTYPERRVADINVNNDQCRFAREGKTMDFSSYYCATL